MLIYLTIFLITAWILWNYIIKDILEKEKLIEPDPIENSYTIERDKLRGELDEKSVSANSAAECHRLRMRIKELDDKIAEIEAQGENVNENQNQESV